MSLLPIDSIDIGERFRRDMGDLPALAASISRVGLLHPIVVMGDPEDERRWRLVAGERRLRACRSLGWDRIHVRIVSGVDLLQAEHDENVVREPFTPSEAVAIAAALRPAIEQAAAEREQAGTPSSESDKGRTDDRLAAAVGMGRSKLRQATAVVEAAEADPALAPIVEAMDEASNVAGAFNAVQALPPDPTPELVKSAAAAVRERRPVVIEPSAPGLGRQGPIMLSESDEWYTPAPIVERVVAALGAIDLDPCADPEHRIPAARHLTAEDDGLMHGWSGRVFCNPPYSRVGEFAARLDEAIAAGDVTEAILLAHARTETRWWQSLSARVVCLVRGRVRFVSGATGDDGGPSTAPSALLYLGPDPSRFISAFADMGRIYEEVRP